MSNSKEVSRSGVISSVSGITQVMGILNVTPDSFFAGSRVADPDAVEEKAARMVAEGADILDIGGQSTRPGAEMVGAEAEISRVVPVIRRLRPLFPGVRLSIDTIYAAVARAAVEAGADMVNDVSGGSIDPEMLATVGSLGVPYICMHMRGTPGTMQTMTNYDDVVADVKTALRQRLEQCRQAGIRDVILDPGFGFAKTPEQNFELIRKLEAFRELGHPLLLGVSRKSTIYKTLNVTPEAALNGTTVLHTMALLKGVDILRVHDVLEAIQAIKLVQMCLGKT